MIKVGILAADTPAAGELIRILINHPDVELKTLASDANAGVHVTRLHRGLTGDSDLELSPVSSLIPEGHDVVFLCGEPWMAIKWMEQHEAAAAGGEVRLIDLTGAFRDGSYGMVYGFPEQNRKALVRGATRASVPSAVAMAIEPALFPLAKNGVLSAGVSALVSVPDPVPFEPVQLEFCGSLEQQRVSSTRLDPIAPQEHRPDGDSASAEVTAAVRSMQSSFPWPVSVKLSRNTSHARGITAKVTTECSVALGELERMFADAYEDHNFTYPVAEIPVEADVANTNKCLLSMRYTTGLDSGLPVLEISTVIDGLLKGAAGTAVHCMNLLFGLSERTGLALKASVV